MEKYKEIERSIIKTYRKEIWSKFVKAVSDYELIKENDNIMVCISGGKDSFLLAKCIEELQKHGRFLVRACFFLQRNVEKSGAFRRFSGAFSLDIAAKRTQKRSENTKTVCLRAIIF